jgi:hypothetical protein
MQIGHRTEQIDHGVNRLLQNGSTETHGNFDGVMTNVDCILEEGFTNWFVDTSLDGHADLTTLQQLNKLIFVEIAKDCFVVGGKDDADYGVLGEQTAFDGVVEMSQCDGIAGFVGAPAILKLRNIDLGTDQFVQQLCELVIGFGKEYLAGFRVVVSLDGRRKHRRL